MNRATLTRLAFYALGGLAFLGASAYGIDCLARWLMWGPAR